MGCLAGWTGHEGEGAYSRSCLYEFASCWVWSACNQTKARRTLDAPSSAGPALQPVRGCSTASMSRWQAPLHLRTRETIQAGAWGVAMAFAGGAGGALGRSEPSTRCWLCGRKNKSDNDQRGARSSAGGGSEERAGRKWWEEKTKDKKNLRIPGLVAGLPSLLSLAVMLHQNGYANWPALENPCVDLREDGNTSYL